VPDDRFTVVFDPQSIDTEKICAARLAGIEDQPRSMDGICATVIDGL